MNESYEDKGRKIMKGTERQGNIELLRILTILGVIVLHYNSGEIGGGFVYADGVNKLILIGLENLFICGVNIFMLISGYFLCTRQARRFIRIIELLIQVILFQLAFYIFNLLMRRTIFSIEGTLRSLVPSNYFVILYIVCYLISPYMNLVIHNLGEKKCRRFMLLLLAIFSVWPTFVDVLQEITNIEFAGLSSIGLGGSQNGYTIVNFLLLYCVGAYLRLYQSKEYNCRTLVLGLLISLGILWGWCFIEQCAFGKIAGSVWAYCNPVIVLESVVIFLIFKNIHIINKNVIKVINKLAKGAFTAYLLHAPLLSFIKISWAVQSIWPIMLVHILISLITIYIICYICYVVWSKITGPFFSWLSSRKLWTHYLC